MLAIDYYFFIRLWCNFVTYKAILLVNKFRLNELYWWTLHYYQEKIFKWGSTIQSQVLHKIFKWLKKIMSYNKLMNCRLKIILFKKLTRISKRARSSKLRRTTKNHNMEIVRNIVDNEIVAHNSQDSNDFLKTNATQAIYFLWVEKCNVFLIFYWSIS